MCRLLGAATQWAVLGGQGGGRIMSVLGPDRDLIFSKAFHTYAPGWFRVHFDDDDDDNDDNNDDDDDEHDGEDQNGHNSDNF